MGSKNRKNGATGSSAAQRGEGGDTALEEIPKNDRRFPAPVNNSKALGVVECGIRDIGGAIQLALAGAEDMLRGVITPQEATVVNTAAGRALKGAELQLKYGRRQDGNSPIALPSPEMMAENEV